MARLAPALLILFLNVYSAHAIDGVIEINQARALAGSVTPGDGAGFPVDINIPGSYVLTSDLIVADPAASGIVISASNVEIDLNGFEIAGPIVCTGLGSAVSCSSGTGWGIAGSAGVSVHGGRVRGFGSFGLLLSDQAQVRLVIADSNAGSGVRVGFGSIVSETIAFRNGDAGVITTGPATLEKIVSSSNYHAGVVTSPGSSVVACAAYDNGTVGIEAGGGSVIRDSSAYLNEGFGISAGNGTMVSDNGVYQNGATGISATNGSSVQRNSVSANGFGLALSLDASYQENTVTANPGGTVTGGINMGSNSCNGATTCP